MFFSRILIPALIVIAAALPRSAQAIDLAPGKAFTYSNTLLYYNNEISGPNKEGSFLSPGHWETDDMSFNYKYSHEGVFFESGMDLRIADDPKVETSTVSMKKLYVKFGDAHNEALIGDFLASLSQYTVGTSMKGARYTHQFSDTLEGIAFAGTPRNSWQTMWGGADTAKFDRQFYGARVDKKFTPESTVGINFVGSNDSRVPAPGNTTALTRNYVGAVDWSLPVYHNIALSGESAYSWTWKDDPANPPPTLQDGWGHLVKGQYGWKGFKTREEYQRDSPFFQTSGGSASPDQVRFKTDNEYKFKGPLKIVAGYTWFHNNLRSVDGQATVTTRMPEGGLRYDGPDWRPSFSTEAHFRDREVYASNTGIRSRTRSTTANVTDKFFTVDTSVDYDHEDVDKSDHSDYEKHDTIGVGLGTSRDLPHGVKLTPNVHWNYQLDRDRLAETNVRTQTIAASLKATFPHSVDASVSYNDNRLMNQAAESTDKKNYVATVGYNIHDNSNTRFEFHYKRNDNNFSEATKNYQESIAEAQLTINF